MSLEPAESAAIRVTWTDPESHFDLRWYGAPDFVVPMWWIGVSDHHSGLLERTEVLAPKLEVPGEVFRWLLPVVGQQAARQLVSLAASATVSRPSTPEGGGPEPAGRGSRRPKATQARRRRRSTDAPTLPARQSAEGRRTNRRPAKAS